MDDSGENGDIADTIARIACFRKLGASHTTIQALIAGDISIQDALSVCPKGKARLHASVYEDLREKQWTDISYEDCARLIQNSKLQTPDQDVFWCGRLLDSSSAITAAAGMAASLTFAHQNGWKDIVLALVAGGTLAVIRAAAYTVADILRWRKSGLYKAI